MYQKKRKKAAIVYLLLVELLVAFANRPFLLGSLLHTRRWMQPRGLVQRVTRLSFVSTSVLSKKLSHSPQAHCSVSQTGSPRRYQPMLWCINSQVLWVNTIVKKNDVYICIYIWWLRALRCIRTHVLSLCAAAQMKVRHQSVVKHDKMWKSLKRVSPEGGLEFWWDAEMCCCFIHVTVKSRERPKDV